MGKKFGSYARIYDIGEKSADRFTLVLPSPEEPGKVDMYGFSEDPYHPQGIGMSAGSVDFMRSYSHLGKLISIDKLPPQAAKFVRQITSDYPNKKKYRNVMNPLMGNPNRPPKAWWERMYASVKRTYSKRTSQHPRITSPEKLRSITGSIWWGLDPLKREEITERYELKNIQWREVAGITSKKTSLVSDTPYGQFWVAYHNNSGKWLVTWDRSEKRGMRKLNEFGSKTSAKKWAEKNMKTIVGLARNPEETGEAYYWSGNTPLESLVAAMRMEWVKACQYEGIPIDAKFVVFAPDNPYAKPGSKYDKLRNIYAAEMQRRQQKNPEAYRWQKFVPATMSNPFFTDLIGGIGIGAGWTVGSIIAKKVIDKRKKK